MSSGRLVILSSPRSALSQSVHSQYGVVGSTVERAAVVDSVSPGELVTVLGRNVLQAIEVVELSANVMIKT